ncbi:hypothetical protein VTN49DRAFT_6536 [Thermomyces lanuginosus]|uniref:uncharacterized protein n=1 Tax=Thermomyces lanuginosus TaxID=5541 RepID=UPI0037448ED2
MSRPTNAHLRQPSASISSQQANVLAMRIQAKKTELEHLRQLRDLSAALAGQMEALEEKLRTLKDGTEAIACVLANWNNVLQAINMATAKASHLSAPEEGRPSSDGPPSLPTTLVRIPANPSATSTDA